MTRRLLASALVAAALAPPAQAAHFTLRTIVTLGGKVAGNPIQQIPWFDAARNGEVAFAVRTVGGAEGLYEYVPTPRGPGHGRIYQLTFSDVLHPLGGFAMAGNGEVVWARGDPSVYTTSGDVPLCDVFASAPGSAPPKPLGRVCLDPTAGGGFMSGVQAILGGGHEAFEFSATFTKGTYYFKTRYGPPGGTDTQIVFGSLTPGGAPAKFGDNCPRAPNSGPGGGDETDTCGGPLAGGMSAGGDGTVWAGDANSLWLVGGQPQKLLSFPAPIQLDDWGVSRDKLLVQRAGSSTAVLASNAPPAALVFNRVAIPHGFTPQCCGSHSGAVLALSPASNPGATDRLVHIDDKDALHVVVSDRQHVHYGTTVVKIALDGIDGDTYATPWRYDGTIAFISKLANGRAALIVRTPH